MSALPCRGPLRAATKSGGLPPDRTLTIAAPARSPLPLEPRLTPYGRVSSRASAASYRNSAARSERTNDRTENHRGAPPAHRDGAAARRDLVRRARDGRARGRDRRGLRARAAEPDSAGLEAPSSRSCGLRRAGLHGRAGTGPANAAIVAVASVAIYAGITRLGRPEARGGSE